jgi:phosphatidylinositol alpha-1,6-mannosyltransferase
VTDLLITNDFPPMAGGEATWYARICETVPQGRVIVLAPRMPGDRAFDAGRPYRVVRRRVPLSARPLARIAQIGMLLWHALWLVRRERVRMVHVGHLYLGPVALALRRLAGIPYVLYLHGGEMAPYMRWRVVRGVAGRVVAEADVVVMNSAYTRERFAAMGMTHPRVEVAPPGVDTGRFRPDRDGASVRRRYGLDGSRVLLTVGRLVERKGHDTVIRALGRVGRVAGPVRYLIAGTGPEESRLRRLAGDLGCADHVIFAGRVPDEDLPDFYAACDVFVMPSRELAERDGVEGFGIVFLEAGACGKPVVGGRSGGIGDAVLDGTTGVLVDPLDEDALVSALTRLLLDPGEAARLGTAGRRYAASLTSSGEVALRRVWGRAAAYLGGATRGA